MRRIAILLIGALLASPAHAEKRAPPVTTTVWQGAVMICTEAARQCELDTTSYTATGTAAEAWEITAQACKYAGHTDCTVVAIVPRDRCAFLRVALNFPTDRYLLPKERKASVGTTRAEAGRTCGRIPCDHIYPLGCRGKLPSQPQVPFFPTKPSEQ